MIGIYKITSPTGRVYIGQSIDIEKRRQKYILLNCKGQTRLYASIQKHSFIEHTFEVVEECTVKELNTRERYWQETYNVLGELGLNCRLTNTSDRSGYLSENTKLKISNSNKGKTFSEESRKKMSESQTGKQLSEKTRKKMSETRKGKPGHSLRKGKKHSEESKNKMSISRTLYRNIGCYTLEGILIKVYTVLKDVELDGFVKVNVSRCLQGCRKSHKKLVWKVVEH